MYEHTRICILIVASVRDYIQKGASMADTLEIEMIAEPHCVHVHHWEIMYIHNTCTYMYLASVSGLSCFLQYVYTRS